MNVVDGDPGPEERGEETTPPVDLEDVVQSRGRGLRPYAPVWQEDVREAKLRVLRSCADVECYQVVHGAHQPSGQVYALQVLDVGGLGVLRR